MRVGALLGPDNAGDVLTGILTSGTGPLDVALYELSPYYAWALAEAAAAGRRVRVLLDAHNADGANPAAIFALRGSDVRVRRAGRWGAAAHWKLLISGGAATPDAILAAGTGNLLRRDAPRHGASDPGRPLAGTREWWVACRGRSAPVSQARRAFLEVWRTAVPATSRAAWSTAVEARPYGVEEAAVGVPLPQVPPLHVEVARERLRLVTGAHEVAALLLLELSHATERIHVTVPYVHPRAAAPGELVDVLVGAAARGVEVRLLLGSDASGRDPAAAGAAELTRLGVPTRVMDVARCTRGHAKGVVVDRTAIVGSANWSRAGLGANLEAAIAVEDPAVAKYFAAALDRDWVAAA